MLRSRAYRERTSFLGAEAFASTSSSPLCSAAAETASTDGGSSASAQPAADTQQPEPAQNDYYQDAGYSEPYDDGSSGFGDDEWA